MNNIDDFVHLTLLKSQTKECRMPANSDLIPAFHVHPILGAVNKLSILVEKTQAINLTLHKIFHIACVWVLFRCDSNIRRDDTKINLSCQFLFNAVCPGKQPFLTKIYSYTIERTRLVHQPKAQHSTNLR